MASSAELRGRVAVVTGATSGIGAATARSLATAGARVVVAARGAARVEAMAAELGGVGAAVDVATEQGVAALADTVRQAAREGPDIVVHAAGSFRLAPLAATDVAVFDEAVAVNLRAAFLLIRTFLPGMLQRDAGDIVTIGSVAGRVAFPANGAYSASKFGVRGMHAVLAAELRGTGVRATLVEPAATDTPLWDDVDPAAAPGLPARSVMLDAAAVADMVLFAVTRPRHVATPNLLVERS